MDRRSMVWLDSAGSTALTQPRGSASLAGLEAAMLAASNAIVQQWWESAVTLPGGSATIALYASVRDQAVFYFQTPVGTIVALSLPAPVASIFLADGETVDPANALVMSIVTAALAVLVDISGNAVTIFLGGVRVARASTAGGT